VDNREEICRSLNFPNLLKLHEAIVAGAAHDARWLLRHGLHRKTLVELGYSAESLRRLKYSEELLTDLGFKTIVPDPTPVRQNTPSVSLDENAQRHIRSLVDANKKADQLKRMSISVHHCKKAGVTVAELVTIGFPIEDLAAACSAAELRRAGFRPMELRRFFNGPELRSAGYSADEMRVAGYSIPDLLRFGYNENHVRSAGYSNAELLAAGLSKYVKEHKG